MAERTDDRAVSEVLGFVLIFALITSAVGLTYVIGFDGLTATRDYERVNNAERAFRVLGDNVDDVARTEAPSRATEIRLYDAGLRIGEPVVFNVTGREAGSTAVAFTAEYEINPIVYDADTGTQLTYSGGALIRSEGGSSVMVTRPHVIMDGDRVVLPVIQTRSAGGSVSGSSTVLIRTSHSGTEMAVGTNEGRYNLTVNVTTDRPTVWRRYFESKEAFSEGETCTVDRSTTPATLTCDVEGIESVYVTAVRIDVRFE